MTLNAPIDNNGVPLGLPQEHFHLFRKDIEFEVKIDNLGKKSLKGTVHVYIFMLFSPPIASS